MPRPLRCNQVRPLEIPLYHTMSRCTRKMRLTDDPKRKDFMLNWLKTLHGVFAVEVCRYALMGNHFHLVLRINVQMAKDWTDREVVERWVRLHPPRDAGYRPLPEADLDMWIENQSHIPEFVAKKRRQLADLGQFMKDFKQRVAEVFNQADQATGAFWEGRYTCVPLESESHILAGMVYVDLNPHAARLCDKPEDDPFTSLHESVKSREKERVERQKRHLPAAEKVAIRPLYMAQVSAEAARGHDPLKNPRLQDCVPEAERHAWTVPVGQTATHARKGLFTALMLEDYLRLVDFIARKMREGKATLAAGAADILERTTQPRHWLTEIAGWISGEWAAA